jgi:hypothetical protein
MFQIKNKFDHSHPNLCETLAGGRLFKIAQMSVRASGIGRVGDGNTRGPSATLIANLVVILCRAERNPTTRDRACWRRPNARAKL